MPPAGLPPAPRPQRGWFGRNWKWFVPLVIVLPIIVCCGGVTAIVGGVFGMIKSSEPYKHALAQAQSNPQVVAAVGTPIKASFFAGGNINLNNDAGNADLVIPVTGPKGAGTIFDDLVNPANRENLLRQTDEICAFITALPRSRGHEGQRYPAPYLTVMDWGHDERDYAAGHSDRAPRLDPSAWAGMVSHIRAIAELARDRHGVRDHAASIGSPRVALPHPLEPARRRGVKVRGTPR